MAKKEKEKKEVKKDLFKEFVEKVMLENGIDLEHKDEIIKQITAKARSLAVNGVARLTEQEVEKMVKSFDAKKKKVKAEPEKVVVEKKEEKANKEKSKDPEYEQVGLF